MGFNKVIIMGNLCADPELRYTPSGTAVSDLRLAVTTKKKSGDETVFVDVTAWDRTAEVCCEYLSKGRPVLVDGRLKMDEWNDKDTGQKRAKISVTANSIQLIGGRNDGDIQPSAVVAPTAPPQEEFGQRLPIQQRQTAIIDDAKDVPF